MATKLFPRNSAPTTDITLSSHTVNDWSTVVHKALSLTQGSSVATETDNTVASLGQAGWGAAANTQQGTSLAFITEPLNAVTISTNPTTNLRGLESNVMANYGLGAIVWRVTTSGQVQDLGSDDMAQGSDTANELGTTEAARTPTLSLSGNIVVAAGERLLVVVFFVSANGTSASGFTASGFYSGAAGATGDTFVSFTETITEQSAAAANPPYTKLYPPFLAQ